MDLDPKIKRLVDGTLEDLFSDKNGLNKLRTKLLYIFFICKFYLGSCE